MAYPYYPTYPQNFYQPTNYQQMIQPAQPMQQTPVQQAVQNYSPVINQSGIIWISGPQEAQMYPIAPNNAVALWEKSGKTIYLKQADATGKPTITVFDLVERAQSEPSGAAESGEKVPTYATKDELSAVVGVVKGFDDLIGSIKADIDTMKGDMYGIAGKKKTVRKQEASEDE